MGLGSELVLWLLVVLYCGIPLCVGGLVGWATYGRRGMEVPASVAGLGLAGVQALVGVTVWFVSALPVWDGVLLGLLVFVGFWGLARPFGRADLGAAALALLVGLFCAGIVELVVRQWLPDPRYQPMPLSELSLLEPAEAVSFKARRMAYGEATPETLSRLAVERVVLHVSDSIGLPPHAFSQEGHSFIDYLDRWNSTRYHLRTSVGGTGPDFYALLVLNWVSKYAVERVVLHLSVPGDSVDMGRSYEFCGPGPILEDRPGNVVFRCPRGPMESSALVRLLASPAPYPVRALSLISATARHIAGHWLRASRSAFSYDWEPLRKEQEMWAVLVSLKQALDDRGVGLTVVLHPHRTTLSGQLGRPSIAARWASRLGELGIAVVDPTAILVAAIATYGEERVYQNQIPRDGHYSDLGHQLMGRYLDERLNLSACAGDGGARQSHCETR